MVDEGGATINDYQKSIRVYSLSAALIEANSGSTSQEYGYGEGRAMSDQFAGKWGPMLGEWAPEKFSRMSSEF